MRLADKWAEMPTDVCGIGSLKKRGRDGKLELYCISGNLDEREKKTERADLAWISVTVSLYASCELQIRRLCLLDTDTPLFVACAIHSGLMRRPCVSCRVVTSSSSFLLIIADLKSFLSSLFFATSNSLAFLIEQFP